MQLHDGGRVPPLTDPGHPITSRSHHTHREMGQLNPPRKINDFCDLPVTAANTPAPAGVKRQGGPTPPMPRCVRSGKAQRPVHWLALFLPVTVAGRALPAPLSRLFGGLARRHDRDSK